MPMKSISLFSLLCICLFICFVDSYIEQPEPEYWENVSPTILVGYCTMRTKPNCNYYDFCDKPVFIEDAGPMHVIMRHDEWFFGSTKTIQHVYDNDNWFRVPDSWCVTSPARDYFVKSFNSVLIIFFTLLTTFGCPVMLALLTCWYM